MIQLQNRGVHPLLQLLTTEDNRMKRVDLSKLEPGDIILTTSPNWESGVIRTATDSDISHAMLYVTSSCIMDSTGDGVHARNPQKLFYDDECAIYVLRLKSPLNDDSLQEVISYVRSEHGAEYSLKEAIRAVTGPKGSGSDRQFCSRLVARAFSNVGIKLVENENFCTPQQLKASSLLMSIEGAVEPITDEEVFSWKKNRDGVAEYIEISNDLLRRARKISSTIRTIEDAIAFPVLNPSRDEEMAEAFHSSGYLTFWQKEITEYPWRYDLAMMINFVKQYAADEVVADYCKSTLDNEAKGAFNHWKLALESLKKNPNTRQLKSWGLLETLYENFVGSYLRRVQTAKDWLKLQQNASKS